MPSDEQIIALLRASSVFGCSTWALRMSLRLEYPNFTTRALRGRLERLARDGKVIAAERRTNMVVWSAAT